MRYVTGASFANNTKAVIIVIVQALGIGDQVFTNCVCCLRQLSLSVSSEGVVFYPGLANSMVCLWSVVKFLSPSNIPHIMVTTSGTMYRCC